MIAGWITDVLRQAGDDTEPRTVAPVGGGSISQAYRVRTDRGEYLLKRGGHGLPGFFAAEARGLALLAEVGVVRVPRVVAWHDDRPATTGQRRPINASEGQVSVVDQPALNAPGGRSSVGDTGGFILLEWLDTPPDADRNRAAEALGHGLAALHRVTAALFGLETDGYIGANPQPNGPVDEWPSFFRGRRLAYQAERARQNGYLDAGRERRLTRLLGRLDELIGHRPPASLLHGDLWGGNWMVGPGGAPVLFDPATYYGDRETDLAFTTLFGGFPESFYRAYDEAWPLPDGWRDRREIYNLYHLLNHLNLFGEGYGGAVDSILRRY